MRGTLGLVLLLGAWLVGAVALAEEQPSAAQMMDDLMYGRGSIGAPFALLDQTGRMRTDREFRGKLMIVYFGYTYCPDVCPADLQSITLALDELGALAAEVQPIFITIDPERDASTLAEYVAAFHPSLIGLTGRPDEIHKLATAYKVFYRRVETGRPGEYSIDHSGVIYLMGKEGEYLGFMPPQTTPKRLAEVLRRHLSRPY